MLRVPKDRMRERSPGILRAPRHRRASLWTPAVAPGAVFHYPANCQRVDAVYNAGIGRYCALGTIMRAVGIFDAPNPGGHGRRCCTAGGTWRNMDIACRPSGFQATA
jgi:hypothetical protein